jgi:hypothetical protein
MRQQFHTDFFFIATYTAAFVFAGILAMRRGVPAGRWLILLALAVAAADCLENYLGLQESLQMRTVSRIKWVLFAPVCGIIALAYWPRAGTFLFRIFQWTAATAAAVAAVLFAIGFLGPDWERFWQGAASALAIWFVTEIPVLILWPDQILGRTVIKDTDIF